MPRCTGLVLAGALAGAVTVTLAQCPKAGSCDPSTITAATFGCLKQGLYCPARTGTCKNAAGASRNAANQATCEAVAGFTWTQPETDIIGAPAVGSWAGHDLMCCSST